MAANSSHTFQQSQGLFHIRYKGKLPFLFLKIFLQLQVSRKLQRKQTCCDNIYYKAKTENVFNDTGGTRVVKNFYQLQLGDVIALFNIKENGVSDVCYLEQHKKPECETTWNSGSSGVLDSNTSCVSVIKMYFE